jgi:hypothetical protein
VQQGAGQGVLDYVLRLRPAVQEREQQPGQPAVDGREELLEAWEDCLFSLNLIGCCLLDHSRPGRRRLALALVTVCRSAHGRCVARHTRLLAERLTMSCSTDSKDGRHSSPRRHEVNRPGPDPCRVSRTTAPEPVQHKQPLAVLAADHEAVIHPTETDVHLAVRLELHILSSELNVLIMSLIPNDSVGRRRSAHRGGPNRAVRGGPAGLGGRRGNP